MLVFVAQQDIVGCGSEQRIVGREQNLQSCKHIGKKATHSNRREQHADNEPAHVL